ncbi:MAG: hypothetical protein U0169_05275 [Polyangiaceae bacterium]
MSLRAFAPLSLAFLALAACSSAGEANGESQDAVVIVDENGVIAWTKAFTDIPLGTTVSLKEDVRFETNDISSSSSQGCTFARSMGPSTLPADTKLLVSGQVSGLPVGGAHSTSKLSGNWLMLRSADSKVWIGLGCASEKEKRIASSYAERSQIDGVLAFEDKKPVSACGMEAPTWIEGYKVMLGLKVVSRVEATDMSGSGFEAASLKSDAASCLLQRTPFTKKDAKVARPKGSKFTFVGQLADPPLVSLPGDSGRFACGTGLVVTDESNNFYTLRCTSSKQDAETFSRDDLDTVLGLSETSAP